MPRNNSKCGAILKILEYSLFITHLNVCPRNGLLTSKIKTNKDKNVYSKEIY